MLAIYWLLVKNKKAGKHCYFPAREIFKFRYEVLYCDCDIPQPSQRRSHTLPRGYFSHRTARLRKPCSRHRTGRSPRHRQSPFCQPERTNGMVRMVEPHSDTPPDSSGGVLGSLPVIPSLRSRAGSERPACHPERSEGSLRPRDEVLPHFCFAFSTFATISSNWGISGEWSGINSAVRYGSSSVSRSRALSFVL